MGAAVSDGSGEVVVGELKEATRKGRGANSGLPGERVTNRAELSVPSDFSAWNARH